MRVAIFRLFFIMLYSFKTHFDPITRVAILLAHIDKLYKSYKNTHIPLTLSDHELNSQLPSPFAFTVLYLSRLMLGCGESFGINRVENSSTSIMLF